MSEAKKRHSDPMNVQIASLRLSMPVEVSMAWASADKCDWLRSMLSLSAIRYPLVRRRSVPQPSGMTAARADSG